MTWISSLFVAAFSLSNQVSALALAPTSNANVGSSSLLENAANPTANMPAVANLTSRYPKVPYEIHLPGYNNIMSIYAVDGLLENQKGKIHLPDLRRFVHKYTDDITREYRAQEFMPRIARDWTINLESFTYVPKQYRRGIVHTYAKRDNR